MLQKHIKAQTAVYLAIVVDVLTAVAFLLILQGSLFQQYSLSTGSMMENAGILIACTCLYISSMYLTGSYHQKIFRQGRHFYIRPLSGLAIGMLVIITITATLTELPGLARIGIFSIIGLFILAALIIITSRVVIRHFINLNISRRLLLVFPNMPETSYLKAVWNHAQNHQLVIAGYCANKDYSVHVNNQLLPFLGNYRDTPKVINEYEIDELLIVRDKQHNSLTTAILQEINPAGILIRIAPASIELLAGKVPDVNFNKWPVISIHQQEKSIISRFLKRGLDLALATPGFVITVMLFPFIAYLIKINSRDPVIFKQERLGLNAKPFNLYKFRTMHVDAEKSGPQLASKNGDPRVIRFGALLRKTHLDELPQFWNIIKGDMSFVGPRPERAFYADQLVREEPYYNYVTSVKPGLTSMGMVKYGYAHNLKEMIERMVYDVAYLNNNSLLVDCKIIVGTFIYFVRKIVTRDKKVTVQKPFITLEPVANTPLPKVVIDESSANAKPSKIKMVEKE